MEDLRPSVGSLGDGAMSRLANMLDNSACGWRQLALAVSEQPGLRYSETELTSCSLQVLSSAGSPGRTLLARLADRSCSLDFLFRCLRKIDHQKAVEYLVNTVPELIQFTVQPQSQQASEGARVVLTCRACGPPGLCYQWFRGKEEVLDEAGSTPELVLYPVAPGHQGHYICRANHGENCIFTQWAHVGLVNSNPGSSPGYSSSLFPGSVSGLSITRQPQSQAVSEGDGLLLECFADANPPAQYEWYHNMEPMPQHKTRSLRIPCVTTADRGEYSCKVYNLYHKAWTDPAKVNIGPSSITEVSWVELDRGPDSQEVKKSTSSMGTNPLQQMANPPPPAKQFFATDKVALLIGNMNYLYHTPLCAPMADVHELTNLLRQMDFKVVSLLDLNCKEMHSAVNEFLLLLDKGVYGLLYFAGHGYENYGNSFMVPIDAPASYKSEHCLCVQKVLTRMQQKQTGLNVFLLDMCRKRNPHDDVIVQPGLLKVTANIVFGYATCVDAEAYEVKRLGVSNGIFISFLKRRVCEDEKVTVMLDRVGEDMGRCAITRGRQALELRSNLSERRSLTDQIEDSDCSAASSARNLQWAVAHDLPKSQTLHFDCGVKVQLGFAAEFSNVMVIFTRIREKPKEIDTCCAQLTDFPQDVDVDLKKCNQQSLVEAGSLLLIEESLPAPGEPGLYTRLRGLQRLRSELTFTVCLQYQYSNMDEDIQESQTVSVGKPLVSKLNLLAAQPPCSFSTCSSSSCVSEDSFDEAFTCGSFTSETSSADSTSTSWSYKSLVTESPTSLRVANEPEESELIDSDAPQPLTFSRSLPSGRVTDANTNKFSDRLSFHSS
ncbi:MALT paracaspase 2 [Genypterus blacodes]|uniref:MALT paracaspase 2 n=1 Tax=Genypterus blacodes TaxID=154954 RepID=UPI003F76C9B8